MAAHGVGTAPGDHQAVAHSAAADSRHHGLETFPCTSITAVSTWGTRRSLACRCPGAGQRAARQSPGARTEDATDPGQAPGRLTARGVGVSFRRTRRPGPRLRLALDCPVLGLLGEVGRGLITGGAWSVTYALGQTPFPASNTAAAIPVRLPCATRISLAVRSVETGGVDAAAQVGHVHTAAVRIEGDTDAFHQVGEEDLGRTYCVRPMHGCAVHGVAPGRVAAVGPVQHALNMVEFEVDRLRQPFEEHFDAAACGRRR